MNFRRIGKMLMALPALAGCEGGGCSTAEPDSVVLRCDNHGNHGWQWSNQRCETENGEVTSCPVPYTPDYHTICVNEELDGFDPDDWENHLDEVRDLCVADCNAELHGFPGTEYQKVCERENLGEIRPQFGWEPGDGNNCVRDAFRNADVDGGAIDWNPGGAPDSRAPLSCDLNSSCCEEFAANICGDIASADLTSTSGRGGDYLSELTSQSTVRLDLPGRNADDTEVVGGEAEYTASECGEETCPFYLGHLGASGGDAVWNVRVNRVIRKNVDDVFVDLMQPVMGVWSPQDGRVVFQEGALRLRTRFTVEGPVVREGDGSYDVEMVSDRPVMGTFDNGVLSLQGQFQLRNDDERAILDLEFRPVRFPPVAALDVPDVIQCTSDGGAILESAFDVSYDPNGDTLRSVFVLDGATTLAGTRVAPGEHTLQVLVENSTRAAALSEPVTFTVGDTTPPDAVVVEPLEFTLCNPEVEAVQIPFPDGTDGCDPDPTVTGRVVASTNPDLNAPLDLGDGPVVLGTGEHTIEWTVTDASGNVSAPVQQNVLVAPSLYVTEAFDLRDRARLTTAGGAGATIVNTGQSGVPRTAVGVESFLGQILSDGPVDVRDRAILNEGVVSTGAVTIGNDVDLGGAIVEFANGLAAPPARSLPEWISPLLPNTTISLEPGQSAILEPGAYESVVIKSRSVLRLQSGVYELGSWQMEPESVLELDLSGGPLLIVVRESLQHRSNLRVSGGDPQDVTLVYVGANEIQFESAWSGELFAPNASVVFGAGNPKTYSGSFLARRVELRPDTTFVCVVD